MLYFFIAASVARKLHESRENLSRKQRLTPRLDAAAMIFKLLVGAAAAKQLSPPLTRREPAVIERREPTVLCPAATQLERTRRWRGGGENLWQSYSRTLETKPVIGNMVTGGLLAFTGDFVMQAAEKNPAYDHLRALRFVGFRICVVRCYTVWVRELEHWVNQHVDGDRRRLLTKTFLDLAIWLPAKDFVYFVWMALLEGLGLTEGIQRSLTMLPRTCPVSWLVWAPAQLLTFGAVPPHLRVVWVNSLALCWNVVMSGFNQAARLEGSSSI